MYKIVYEFLSEYNKKYKSNIDFNIIIQEDDDINVTIEKVCNYILEITFENNPNENLEEDLDNSEQKNFINLNNF